MTELERLIAEREISQVLRNYIRSMDRIDADLGYSVWHEGGTADYGPIFQGTGRGFVDWVCEFHRGLVAQSHQLSNISIVVDGEHGSSETYITVALLSREGDGYKVQTGRGRYIDRWSKRGGRWAIDHRHYVHDFDIIQQGPTNVGWGTRDLDDPSYAALAGLATAAA